MKPNPKHTALFFLLPLALCGCFHAAIGQQTSNATPVDPAPNYADKASWVCRPGADDICTTGLDAVVEYPDGHKVREPFKPAANPPIDCFYVYPTVSLEQRPYADMVATPEVQRTVHVQAGRLSSRCRVFAPIYRQSTLMHLRQSLGGAGGPESEMPQLDVEAAWNYYLQHDNKGRGVVIVGHSQGTIVLQNLMEKLIDGKPAQSLLVSAFLAGDPSLAVPPGKAVGGTFAHIPVCSAASQTGCVYVWGTFLAGDASPRQVFGRVRADNLVSACVNPAAPSGGTGSLKFFHEKRADAPANDPPWVETVGQLSGVCSVTASGNGFRVTVGDGPFKEQYNMLLQRAALRTGWGLHVVDVSLVQGNILDVLDAEIAEWGKAGSRK